MSKAQPLKTEIIDGRIVISIGLDCLQTAIEASPSMEGFEDDDGNQKFPKVTDAEVFAKEVVMALENEEEDGTNLIHKMFDEAFEYIGENGAEGIEFPDDAG